MHKLFMLIGILILASGLPIANAMPKLTVAYAGSMGVVMDRHIDPTFDQEHHVRIHGIGQGSWGLAHLIAEKKLHADVFISVTPGPMTFLIKKGLVNKAIPIASTQIAIAYSPKSRFAHQFSLAAQGKKKWYKILEKPDVRFGRTDPLIDPLGRNTVLCFQLAGMYYHQTNLVKKILGSRRNPRQIFTETSLLSRLQSGQIDAAAGYLSAIKSYQLPYIQLPAQINLGNPRFMKQWYSHAGFNIKTQKGHTIHVNPQPLVFYAGTLKDTHNPELSHNYINFLSQSHAQTLFRASGYNQPKGKALE